MPDSEESDADGCFACLGCCLGILMVVATLALCVKIWKWGTS